MITEYTLQGRNESTSELQKQFIKILYEAEKNDRTLYNLCICMLLERVNSFDADDDALWNYARNLSKGELKRMIKRCRECQGSGSELKELFERHIVFIRKNLLRKPAKHSQTLNHYELSET